MTWNKFLKFWLPVLIWMGVIFSFSTIQMGHGVKIDWTDFIFKKTAHMIEYGILTVLNYRALSNSGVIRRNAAIIAVLFSFVYGLTDEFHQSFTPGREPRLRDVGFDTIGSLIAIYSIWKLLPKAPLKLKNWAEKLQIS